jgi:carboxymethylenebutenolidase
MTETSAEPFVALPALGSGPGVLVLHAWWGLNDFFRDFCRRLAGEGFVVAAPDLYHGQVAATVDEATALRAKLNGPRALAEIFAAAERLQQLSGRPGLGVVGFSLGGRFALELALRKPEMTRAVTVFYALMGADFSQAQAAYLCHFAEIDPYAADSGKKKFEKALKASGRPYAVYTYPGTGHWFFEQDRPQAYNAAAAELAWTRTVEFLNAHLDPA